jgi:Bacteriodetes cell division protein (FtsL-like)
LRWQYMTIESENMNNARKSEMADRLGGRGMEEKPTQPKRIVVENKAEY